MVELCSPNQFSFAKGLRTIKFKKICSEQILFLLKFCIKHSFQFFRNCLRTLRKDRVEMALLLLHINTNLAEENVEFWSFFDITNSCGQLRCKQPSDTLSSPCIYPSVGFLSSLIHLNNIVFCKFYPICENFNESIFTSAERMDISISEFSLLNSFFVSLT